MIQAIKLKPSRQDKERDKIAKLNKKLARKVNMIFALAIIIEGLAKDLGKHDLAESAEKLRSFVHETNRNSSEIFGDWSETVEMQLKGIVPDQILLDILCEKIYLLSKSMEDSYRSREPLFDFYKRNEVAEVRKYAKPVYPPYFHRVSHVITKLMMED